MLDLRLIRREPETVRAALARRGGDVAERVDRVVELDARWRQAT
ncbi:MAG: serine--tRNA ligase, partial [Solirubrobacteraceae bacterium]